MIKLERNALSGEVEAISSKSFAHRILLCSALADQSTKVFINEYSKDVLATIDCVKKLGAKVNVFDKYVEIEPLIINRIDIDEKKEFFCNESGTTYRFIVPLGSSIYKNTEFLTAGILGQRPMEELTNLMKKCGCEIKFDGNLKVKGKFKFKEVEIRGDISSQYISALLLTSILQDNDVEIKVSNKMESRSYVDITLEVMKKFDIDVQEEYNNFIIPNNQKYISPRDIIVEGDWSNSAFFLVAGAFSEKGIKLKNLNIGSVQGDKEIIDILKKYGAEIEREDKDIKIKKGTSRAFEVDITNIPDLAPILAVLASSVEGISKIKNIRRLRLKESDRVKSTIEMINNLGGVAFEKGDEIIIEGKGKLIGGVVNPYNDHRIAMSACIASTLCNKAVILQDEKAIDKSYPNFLRDFVHLGGSYVINNG